MLRAWFDDPERALFGPRAVLVSRGYLYVADTGNKRVVRFDKDGKKVSEWGSAGDGPGEFVEPVGLAADAAGNVLVADTGNHRIQVFDAEGKFLRQFPVFGLEGLLHRAVPGGRPHRTRSSRPTLGGTGRTQYDEAGTLLQSWKPRGRLQAAHGDRRSIRSGGVAVSDRETHRLYPGSSRWLR